LQHRRAALQLRAGHVQLLAACFLATSIHGRYSRSFGLLVRYIAVVKSLSATGATGATAAAWQVVNPVPRGQRRGGGGGGGGWFCCVMHAIVACRDWLPGFGFGVVRRTKYTTHNTQHTTEQEQVVEQGKAPCHIKWPSNASRLLDPATRTRWLCPIRMLYEATASCEVQNTKIGPCATRALPCLGNMAFEVVKMGT
jgi:hypothetical protein